MDCRSRGRSENPYFRFSLAVRVVSRARGALISGLLVLGLAGALAGYTHRFIQTSAPPDAISPPRAASQGDEPSLPKMLELEEESPGRVRVTVLPGIEGQGRVGIESDRSVQSVQWKGTQPQGLLKLRKAEGPRQYRFDVKRKNPKLAARVTVGLTLEDDQGRAALTVSEEITLAGAVEQSSPSPAYRPLTGGFSSNGTPVVASVPSDAPAPKVQEAVQ